MNRKKWKGKLIRALVIAALVLLIVGAIYLILTNYLPDLIPVLRRGSQAEIEAYIKRTTGFRGVVLVALLQCLQVLSIVFPGAPIQIAAGIVYGAPVGFAICLISFVTVNFAIFTFARRLGGKLNDWIDLETPQSGFFRDQSHPAFKVFIVNLLPVVPNGIIPYIAARTQVTSRGFVMGTLCGALPSILFMCSVGHTILKGNFWTAGLLCAGFLLLVVVLWWKMEPLMAWADRRRRRIAGRFRK